MSYTDFLITEGNGNVSSPPTGSSLLNSALSSPLTSSTQCRSFNVLGESSKQTYGNFLLSSSVSGGIFVNIPDTKSVSMRMWGRATYFSVNGFSLLAKTNPPNNSLNDYGNVVGDSSRPNCGYEFQYSINNYGSYRYSFGGYSGQRTPIDIVNNLQNFDTWIGLRMDIVPVKVNKIINGTPISSSFKDIVTLYTASLATPDNWIQIYTTDILTTDSRYVPWDTFTTKNNATPGPNILVNTSSYGFAVRQLASTADKVYIDDFKIFVEDAF